MGLGIRTDKTITKEVEMERFINDTMHENPIVIFSKSYCQVSNNVKQVWSNLFLNSIFIWCFVLIRSLRSWKISLDYIKTLIKAFSMSNIVTTFTMEMSRSTLRLPNIDRKNILSPRKILLHNFKLTNCDWTVLQKLG